MLGRQHSTPALAQQMIAVLDFQMLEQIVEFVQEKVNPPEVGTFVAQMSGAADAKLIIMDNGAATIRKVSIAKQIIMRRSWSSVNNEKWNAICGKVAGYSIPSLPPEEIRHTFMHRLGHCRTPPR